MVPFKRPTYNDDRFIFFASLKGSPELSPNLKCSPGSQRMMSRQAGLVSCFPLLLLLLRYGCWGHLHRATQESTNCPPPAWSGLGRKVKPRAGMGTFLPKRAHWMPMPLPTPMPMPIPRHRHKHGYRHGQRHRHRHKRRHGHGWAWA